MAEDVDVLAGRVDDEGDGGVRHVEDVNAQRLGKGGKEGRVEGEEVQRAVGAGACEAGEVGAPVEVLLV